MLLYEKLSREVYRARQIILIKVVPGDSEAEMSIDRICRRIRSLTKWHLTGCKAK